MSAWERKVKELQWDIQEAVDVLKTLDKHLNDHKVICTGSNEHMDIKFILKKLGVEKDPYER